MLHVVDIGNTFNTKRYEKFGVVGIDIIEVNFYLRNEVDVVNV